MPAYLFYRLSPGAEDAPPVQMMLFRDNAAMRRALSAEFPTGCDVWQGRRFVGQFHPPSPPGAQAVSPAASGPPSHDP
jgi:hypothetical protein